MTAFLLALAGLGATHHHSHHARATWEACRSDIGCHWYPIEHAPRRPTGRTHWCMTSPAVTSCFTYPRFTVPTPRVTVRPLRRQAVTAQAGRTELMLVTWYGWTGAPMANGIMPSVGWAACGYDLRLGERVSVPGVGILTCGDRIGFQPWLHIDVYGVPLATGYRWVTVLL